MLGRRFCWNCDLGRGAEYVVKVVCEVMGDFGFGVDDFVSFSEVGLLSLFLVGIA